MRAADENGWKSGPPVEPVDADAAPAEAPIAAEPVEEPEQEPEPQIDERIPEHLRPVNEVKDATVDFADTTVLVGNWQGIKKKKKKVDKVEQVRGLCSHSWRSLPSRRLI